MEIYSFAELQPEFMQRVSLAVYCNMTTIDPKSQSCSRVLHQIWDGPICRVISCL